MREKYVMLFPVISLGDHNSHGSHDVGVELYEHFSGVILDFPLNTNKQSSSIKHIRISFLRKKDHVHQLANNLSFSFRSPTPFKKKKKSPSPSSSLK